MREIHIQIGLDRATAAASVRADADALADSVPCERRGIVSILEIVLLQSRPIAGGHREIDYLNLGIVKQGVGLNLRQTGI